MRWSRWGLGSRGEALPTARARGCTSSRCASAAAPPAASLVSSCRCLRSVSPELRTSVLGLSLSREESLGTLFFCKDSGTFIQMRMLEEASGPGDTHLTTPFHWI